MYFISLVLVLFVDFLFFFLAKMSVSHSCYLLSHIQRYTAKVASITIPASEGDFNMHRGKGFYITVLIREESHPVTALQPVLVSIHTPKQVRPNPQTCSKSTNTALVRTTGFLQRRSKHKKEPTEDG